MINKDFYPTPPELISKMLSKINIREHKNILDPSVWKWDIIRYMKDKYQYTYWLTYYWIEIEYQLREISKQYCNIIWFDFLTYSWYLNIDLIVANFPFSNWDKHFLKAWDLLDWWEMVCILNAETIRNDFSESRKLINKIIKDNNASVEYIQNAFVNAERKTGVEIALIHIKKEKKRLNSIFEWFEKDFLNQYSELWWYVKENEIVQWNNQIDHLVRMCDIIKKEYYKKYVAERRFNYYLNKILNDEKSVYFSWPNFKDWIESINDWICEINEKFWGLFFNKTDIRNKVTSKVFEDFIKEYNNSNLDFTFENIQQVTDIIMWKSGELEKENIEYVFDLFTKYYPENRSHIEWWAHNSAWMIGKKVILPNYIELDWDWNIKGIRWDYKDKCRDIDKVFCNLTWKDYKNISKLEDAVNGEETEFFKVVMYKKWTIHLTFKDKEVVKLFNLAVCKNKNWIPPTWFKFK